MRYLGLLLVFLFITSHSLAETRHASGASKRRHDVSQPAVDIDDAIRAQEDPNFSQYLKDRERSERETRAAELQIERQRREEAIAYEKARLQYNKEESKRPVVDEFKEEQKYLREQQAWEQQQEKLRLAEEMRTNKIEKERIVRFQKALPQLQQRMPASK